MTNLPDIKDGEPCEEGKTYKMDCNTCQCGKDNKLMCTKVACLNPDDWKKTRKSAPKDQNIEELKKVCIPGKVYKKGCQRCFCTDLKTAECTTKKCSEIPKIIRTYEDVHPGISNDMLETLPDLPHEAAKCSPGKRYRVDCNVCLCLVNGNMLCTRKLCLSIKEVNRLKADNMNGKPCGSSVTEAADECVNCKCKNGKYECSPIDDCVPTVVKRRFGGNTNNILRTKLMLSMDVNSEMDKECIPKMVYKANCNFCYCQNDASLRCTRKGCLNFLQVERLEKQRQKLLGRKY